MGAIVPSQRPKVSERRIAEILVERGVRDPVAVIGWPGRFADMGRPGNDRGICNDAIIFAPKNDKQPGRWLLDCRVDVIVEAEAGNSPEALAAAWGKVLGKLRDSALPDMLSGPRAKVFGAQDFDIARSRTRHGWVRTLKFKVWAAALDAG